jgi:hypothetical protein
MKYKIVIVNYSKSLDLMCINNKDNSRVYKIASYNINLPDWADLGLYGVHIFETEDLESFDLLEAQKEKNNRNLNNLDAVTGLELVKQVLAEVNKPEISCVDIAEQRKAEIKKIALKMWTNIKGVGFKEVVGSAIYFVDNFDTQFESFEGSANDKD